MPSVGQPVGLGNHRFQVLRTFCAGLNPEEALGDLLYELLVLRVGGGVLYPVPIEPSPIM